MIEKIKHKQLLKHQHLVGKKAEGLVFLQKHKFEVPPFYLLDYDSLLSIKNNNRIADNLTKDWINKFNIEADSLWAIRSSANVEDGMDKSYAGLFTSELNIKLEDVPSAIRKVLNAYFSIKDLKYADIEDFKFGIIIQKMIVPEYSGVAFSHNPLHIEEKNIFINIIPGLGEALVSGAEEAMLINYADKKIEYSGLDQEFRGYLIKNQTLKQSGEEIKANTQQVIKRLIKGINKINRIKKYPVDIEFAIKANKIYWLQVRPITHKKIENKTIWDNNNIGDNYPDISLPLSISFVKISYFNAYNGLAKFLGMSKKDLEKNKYSLNNMVGSIYGGLYYGVTSWQQLLYQLPFGKKTSKQITKIWEMEEAAFKKPTQKPSFIKYLKFLNHIIYSFLFFNHLKRKFEANYNHVLNEYQTIKFNEKSHQELINLYKNINTKLGENWIIPVLNGFFALLQFSTLKFIFKKSRLNTKYPNFINDVLYSQGDVISVKIVREFKLLLNTIRQDEKLNAVFQANSSKKLYDEVSNHFPKFLKQINRYIEQYGERCNEGELKFETINYKENPILFYDLIKSSCTGKTEFKNKLEDFNYKTIIKKHYKFNLLKKYFILKLTKITISRITDRENYRFYRTKSFNLIRMIFRAMDNYLYTNKQIENKGDSLYLKVDEITNPAIVNSYKSIIKDRQNAYKKYQKINRASRYMQEDERYIPVDTSPIDDNNKTIKGVGCCSGNITKKVILIKENKMPKGDLSDKILVAKYFEPGAINLFAQASGVISERGNLLSHTAILCREMGIPSIVGAKNILSKINDGDILKMNGATGEINILKDE